MGVSAQGGGGGGGGGGMSRSAGQQSAAGPTSPPAAGEGGGGWCDMWGLGVEEIWGWESGVCLIRQLLLDRLDPSVPPACLY
jgi:hypothetical protein